MTRLVGVLFCLAGILAIGALVVSMAVCDF